MDDNFSGTEIGRVSLAEPWVQQTPYLLQLPGIGLLTAMTILSAIGDICRFPTAKKLVGYAGLGAKIHASGQTHRTGGITKQGRKELRAVLVEAAWIAVRYDQHWKEQFERLGRQKAIVAIARKLLVILWHVLTAKVADRRAEPQQVARYFIRWGRQLRVKTTMGIKASDACGSPAVGPAQTGADLGAGPLWQCNLPFAAFDTYDLSRF